MPRWEYAPFIWGGEAANATRRVGFSHRAAWGSIASEDFWATMNRLGEGGWELISTEHLTGSSERPFTESWILYFKRPLQERQPGTPVQAGEGGP
jgi:hypothetical protein